MNRILHLACSTSKRSAFGWLLMLIMLMLPNLVMAQAGYTITGKVISSADKQGVIGANVVVDGTTTGTATDVDGNFTLRVTQARGVLVVSYLGFKTQQVPFIQGKTTYDVTLESDDLQLDDVVVVGYGSMQRKEVTGAVARVTSEEITKISTSDLGTAIQGLIAGVNVTAQDGEPGAASNIQIRGLSSISGDSSPLYVVDGVPYESDPGLSSNEIESIDVLKDAASAAIYGTRGAGGVILITTKQGKQGEMRVSFDGYYGVQKIQDPLQMMDTEQYAFVALNVLRMEDDYNGDNRVWLGMQQYAQNFFNNSELYNIVVRDNRPIQNYSLSVSGGRQDLTYNFMANYFNQEGTVINTSFERYNVRSNVNFKRKNFTFNTSLGFTLSEKWAPSWGLVTESYKWKPTSTEIDPNQSLYVVATGDNDSASMSTMLQRIKQTTQTRAQGLNGNFYLAYTVAPGLTLSTRLGVGYDNTKAITTAPIFEIYDEEGELYSSSTYRSSIKNTHTLSTRTTSETMLNYHKKIKKHDLKLTGVFSIECYTYEQYYAQMYDLVSNDVPSLNAGTADALVGSGSGQWGQDRTTSLVGMLARGQYNYAQKYMLSASIRRDGSSRFSADNRWGMFPSVSAGWNISEEPFWKALSLPINSFKFRASYGTTGNQSFTDYLYSTELYGDYDYVFGTGENENINYGFTQTSFSNPDITWETTTQINVGFDIALFKSKFNISLDYYLSQKDNMLFPMVVPPSAGTGNSSTVTINAGNMENEGFEIGLNYRNTLGKVRLSIGATAATNNNTVTKMAGDNEMYYFSDGNPLTIGNTGDYVTALKAGYEAGAFFVMETDGIINTEQKLYEYQKIDNTARMGDLIYVDQNDDGVIDEDDRVYGGSGIPEFEFGFNMSASYKGFDFSMNWYASVGNEIINATKIYTYQNCTNAELIYAWSPTNPTSTIPSYRSLSSHDNFRSYTDRWIEDGSFLRLKNITLGYTIPQKITNKIGVSKLRVYIAADNAWTITNYSGYDPEVGNNGLSRRGLDFGSYPTTIQIRGGCQLQF